mmetsp:Transcript_33276/g.87198  ORF Transcript_33276/g.87198 Transcript_33276/m.87198 type:complete len:212 (-) Transcript_33276:2235-2870(-)
MPQQFENVLPAMAKNGTMLSNQHEYELQHILHFARPPEMRDKVVIVRVGHVVFVVCRGDALRHANDQRVEYVTEMVARGDTGVHLDVLNDAALKVGVVGPVQHAAQCRYSRAPHVPKDLLVVHTHTCGAVVRLFAGLGVLGLTKHYLPLEVLANRPLLFGGQHNLLIVNVVENILQKIGREIVATVEVSLILTELFERHRLFDHWVVLVNV